MRNVLVFAFFGAMGGLLFGLDQGFMNGALPLIQKEMKLSTEQAALFSSVLAWAAAFGAFTAGWVARWFGRKRTIILAALLFFVCTLAGAMAPNYEVLFSSRLLLGLAVGIAAFVVPLYLSEIAPTHMRGGIVAMYQLMITAGILMVFASNALIQGYMEANIHSWRYMLAIISIPALVMFVASFILPRSPRWLILQGLNKEARLVLQRIRSGPKEIEFELQEMQQSIAASAGSSRFVLLSRGFFWKVLLLGVSLQMLQQFSGINSVIYYSTEIFHKAGIHNAALATVIVGLVNMLTTILAVLYVDRWGRKPILYVGLVLMVVTLFYTGSVFRFEQGGGTLSDGGEIAMVAAVLIYIFAFAISLGPIVWILCAEIFPLEGREIGLTVTTIANWVFAAMVVQGSEIVLNSYGGADLFTFFSGCCLLGIVLVYLFVPETKRVPLEEMEARLRAGKRLKRIGA
jgi:SP family galactose:H+ symporter-like MFS transporter